MERAAKFQKTNKNFDSLISKLSENEILNLNAMMCIRGGDADGNGSTPIIVPPPPPIT